MLQKNGKTWTDICLYRFVEIKKKEESDAPIPDGFGEIREGYTWRQCTSEVEVRIPFPEEIESAKELDIIIEPTRLRIGIKGKPPVIEVNSSRLHP